MMACMRILLSLAVVLAGCGSDALSGASLPPSPRAIVSWADLRWSPAPTPTLAPPPADVRLCRSSELSIVERAENGATGRIIQSFGIGNRSGTACLLRGAPGVRLVGTDGRPFAEVLPDKTRLDPSGTGPNWAVLGPGLSDIPPGYEPLRGGQARFSFMTYGSCQHPVLARYEFVFWWDPTPLVLRLDPPARFSGGRCDAPGEGLALWVWPVAAATTPAPPTPSPLPLVASIEAPPTATAGRALDYLVTLMNTSTAPLRFAACPTYGQWIVPSRAPTMRLNEKGQSEPVYARAAAKDTLRVLNCEQVPAIAAGTGVTFAMRIEIFPRAETGPAALYWEGASTRANARVDIVAP